MSTRRKRPSGRPAHPTPPPPKSTVTKKAPFDTRVDTNAIGQVGRRPGSPSMPLIIGVMWVAVGVVILVTFTASWRFIVGIVCIGVGGLFIRGGLAAIVRRSR
jgi:hypothetical protein